MLDATGVDQVPALAQQPDGRLLVAWQTLTTTGRDGHLPRSAAPPERRRLSGHELRDRRHQRALHRRRARPPGRRPCRARRRSRVQPDGRIDRAARAPRCYGLAPTGRRNGAVARRSRPGLRVARARDHAGRPHPRRRRARHERSTDAFVDAFRPGGSFDTSFGINSGVTFGQGARRRSPCCPTGASPSPPAPPSCACSLTARSDDRAVAGGITALAAGRAGPHRRRRRRGRDHAPDARRSLPDPTFGAGGTAGLGGVAPAAVAVQADGKLARRRPRQGTDAAVLRLPANAPVRPPVARSPATRRAPFTPERPRHVRVPRRHAGARSLRPRRRCLQACRSPAVCRPRGAHASASERRAEA